MGNLIEQTVGDPAQLRVAAILSADHIASGVKTRPVIMCENRPESAEAQAKPPALSAEQTESSATKRRTPTPRELDSSLRARRGSVLTETFSGVAGDSDGLRF